MKEEIQDRWLAMEKEKMHFLSILEQWSEEALRKQPADGGWNALQVLNHIITSEYGTLSYLKKKTSAAPEQIEASNPATQESGAKLNEALKSDRKWKAPDVLPDPDDGDDLRTAAFKWMKLREGMHAFFEQIDPEYTGRQVFKHPIVGRIDLLQTMEFLTNHIVHHQHQLKRIAEGEG